MNPKINVNQAADTGNSPLHAAANNGNTEMVTILVKSPDINVNITNPQCENATAIHLAVMHGLFIIVFLIKSVYMYKNVQFWILYSMFTLICLLC